MKTLKFMLLGLSLLFITSCSDPLPIDSLASEKSIEEIESRRSSKSCWFCISEDILGAAQGGAIGSFGGPMGIAIGAAVVGAYKSIREHEAQNDASAPYSGEYLNELNALYELEQEDNNWNYIGIKHNQLLDLMIINNSSLENTEDYYDIMMVNILEDPYFKNFQETPSFKNTILNAMENGVEIPEEYVKLMNAFQSSELINNQEAFMQFITDNTIIYQNDQVALQILATAYHTWNFWNNL